RLDDAPAAIRIEAEFLKQTQLTPQKNGEPSRVPRFLCFNRLHTMTKRRPRLIAVLALLGVTSATAVAGTQQKPDSQAAARDAADAKAVFEQAEQLEQHGKVDEAVAMLESLRTREPQTKGLS